LSIDIVTLEVIFIIIIIHLKIETMLDYLNSVWDFIIEEMGGI